MLIIGHRGCSYPGYNQNTIRSFRRVAEDGAPAFEFDVQRTVDEELVIVHNLNLREVSTGTGYVNRTTLSEVRSLWAGDPNRGKDRIPTLDEVLDLAEAFPEDRRPVLHLELKGDGTGTPAGQVMRNRLAEGRLRQCDFLVSSFDWEELRAIRRVCPELDVALLDGAIRRKELLIRVPGAEPYLPTVFAYGEEDYMLPRGLTMAENREALSLVEAPEVRTDLEREIRTALTGAIYTDELLEAAAALKAVSVNLWYNSLSREFLDRAHTRGLKVLVYTMNRPEDMIRLAEMGIDGFFTDFYSRAVEILG